MSGQRCISASVTIDASPERVWELLCETSRYAEWVDGTIEVVRTDGPAAPGVTYDERTRVAGPWKEATHWRVAEFDPMHMQVHEGEGISLVQALAVVLEIEPRGEQTELTLSYRYTPRFGPVGSLIATAVAGTVTREQQRTVENFKALVERETTSAQAEALSRSAP